MTILNESSGLSPSTLSGRQRKYLRGRANSLDPLVMVGKHGVTNSLIEATTEALDSHELIKVRFLDLKDQKKELIKDIADRSSSHLAGMIGHVGILYRQQEDPEKRNIDLPGSTS